MIATMGRNPKARAVVLDAAERIVKDHGAAHLTFDKLAEASGVTRGGITYHFPTKEGLLRALVERGLEHWKRAVREGRPDEPCCPRLSDTLGHVRSSCDKDEDHQRLVGGLVAAATHDPSLLDPVRAYHAARFADRTWTDRELRLFLLEMAAEGLFWQELFKLYRLPTAARARLVALLEELTVAWGRDGDEAPPDAGAPPADGGAS